MTLSHLPGSGIRVVSVNTGEAAPIHVGRREISSGIDKRPCTGPVAVGRLGLQGDRVVNRKHHGGPDQAVYLYSLEDYAHFQPLLDRELPPGSFGENLTVSGLESAGVCIGDRVEVGTALLEVTAPRIPCDTLVARIGNPAFARTFREARRPGLYTRVLREGEVAVGDPARLISCPAPTPSIAEMFELFFDPRPGREALERHLAAPIAVRARQDYQERLGKLLARS